jgi:hypothetical protein
MLYWFCFILQFLMLLTVINTAEFCITRVMEREGSSYSDGHQESFVERREWALSSRGRMEAWD